MDWKRFDWPQKFGEQWNHPQGFHRLRLAVSSDGKSITFSVSPVGQLNFITETDVLNNFLVLSRFSAFNASIRRRSKVARNRSHSSQARLVYRKYHYRPKWGKFCVINLWRQNDRMHGTVEMAFLSDFNHSAIARKSGQCRMATHINRTHQGEKSFA